jgi:hypothetical protein
MLDVMVAINAAEALVWGWSANRAINHSEWSNRKIDMSAGGGINSDGWSAAELRRRVAARMDNTGQDWFDTVTKDEMQELLNPIISQLTAVQAAADAANWGINSDQGTRVMVADNTNLTNRALASADLANWGVNDPVYGTRQGIALVDAKVSGLQPQSIQPPPEQPQAAAVVVTPPPGA